MTFELDWDATVLTPLFQQSGFATAARYYPAADAPFDITGIWQEPFKRLELLGPDAPTASAEPALGVQLSQFPAPPRQNDRVVIVRTGAQYVVQTVEPDGVGGAKLVLNLEDGA